MRRSTLLLLTLVAAACGSDSDDPITPPPPPPPPPSDAPFLISGSDMSGGPQNVNVTQEGTGTVGATVTVNGTALTGSGGGLYQGAVTPAVQPGGQMTIVVSANGHTATGVGTVPATASITAPTPVARGNPLTIGWVSTTSPDSFFAGLNYTANNSSYVIFSRVPGDRREAVIETAGVPIGATDMSLIVFGFNIGTFTGHVATGSNMRIRTLNGDRPFEFGVP